jgi:hypothetical protein
VSKKPTNYSDEIGRDLEKIDLIGRCKMEGGNPILRENENNRERLRT